MRALVYQGSSGAVMEDRPRPKLIEPTDALVRITKTTICGTDLHILKGHVPSCAPGRILGHEGVGVVQDVGTAVRGFKVGDRVLISCITSCGRCAYCRRGMPSHCSTGGWILGNTIDGTQAEWVRIPHADSSLYAIPADTDEEAMVMLSDILPTGLECGVQNGGVQPGSTVAIVGSGPIGLATLLTAQLYSPAQIIMLDPDQNRLEIAKGLGATSVIDLSGKAAVEAVLKLTEGIGVDVAIEAVGLPASFELCGDLIAPGGTIANIGVHGAPVSLHLERLWDRNITLTTRLVDAVSTPMLLRVLRSRRINPKSLVSHRFKLDRMMDAYDTFGRAKETRALKVLVETPS